MKKEIFKGAGTAISTPFEGGEVNYKAYDRLLDYQLDNDIDAIIVCGTTGESATMDSDEKKRLIEHTLEKVDGRAKVIAGTGGNNTKEAIAMSKFADSIVVDGLLVVTPYYNKATQDGLVKHYKLIADSVNTPIIAYNVPSRTGVNITPETCKKLSEIPNINAIKEASGNISQVAKIAALCGDNLNIYSGNDDQIIPVLALGGKGVISVLSNVMPFYTHQMVMEYLDGHIDSARQMQLDVLDLCEALFSEVNPIPVKEALNQMGFDFGEPRMPLTPMSRDKAKVLTKSLQNHHLL